MLLLFYLGNSYRSVSPELDSPRDRDRDRDRDRGGDRYQSTYMQKMRDKDRDRDYKKDKYSGNYLWGLFDYGAKVWGLY